MRTAKWAALTRMDHPPIMVNQLVEALKTTRPWREAMSLSAHVAKRAIEEKMISASREDRQLLGMEVKRGRDRSQRTRLRGAAAHPTDELQQGTAAGHSAPAPLSSSARRDTIAWNSQVGSSSANTLVPIGPDGVIGGTINNGGGDMVLHSANQAAPTIARIDVLDCTFGGGSHSRAILEGGDPFTRVVALDCDLDVASEADQLAKEFGPKRFRFFANHMSNALTMFGEKKFDFIILDPGPNAMQLFDPSRGFAIDMVHNHSLDLRYSCKVGTPALKWINSEEIISASTMLSRVGLMDFRLAHVMMARLKDRRPLTGSLEVLNAIGDGRFGDLPEDTWVTQARDKQLSAAMRFMMSLRAVINNEVFELETALRHSMLLLKPHGHVAVFTRLPYERQIVKRVMADEPYSLLSYSTRIEEDEVAEFGAPPSMEMSLFRKLGTPAAVITNSVKPLTNEEIARSSYTRMAGLQTTQPFKDGRAFPANNFTFNGVIDEFEKEALDSIAEGPKEDDEGVPKDPKERRRKYSIRKQAPHRF